MNEESMHQTQKPDDGFVPWQQHANEKDSSYFEVRYKRRYMLLMILFVLGMIWMGTSIFDKNMSEMFFVVAPLLIIPLIIKFSGIVISLMLAVLIPTLLYFASPELADLLGKITVVLMFFVFFPVLGLLWVFALFDQRPQLLIGPEGICCRQFSEDTVPWEDITFIHVSTYERLWFLKVENLSIGLRDFSCYPEPSSLWTPYYLIFRSTQLWKKPSDPASIPISGMVLDPPLPFVMKAIEHFRPERKPKRSRKKRT
ncbi:MAG: hypothetical protein ACR2QJ_14895 [Geminicoccaceae bacterium]